jgi:drug/metabolite transporter (DMT)-like permease
MNVRLSHLWPGVPLALLSAVLFGASTPVAKLFLADLDPRIMAALLYLGAGVGLFPIFIASLTGKRQVTHTPLRLSDAPSLLLVIASGGIIGPLLLMLGLSRIEATSASLLLNLESVGTLVIAWIVFRENVDKRLFVGALAILCGAATLTWGGSGFSFDLGALLVAIACLAWAIDNNLTRKLSAVDPVEIALIKGLVAGSTNLAFALARGAELPSVGTVLSVGTVGFLGYGNSLVLFIVALRHLGAARTGAYFALAPFMGAILAIPLLNDL